jgi:hypothetical protein
MRDDELRERLRDCNPWWRAATTGGDALAWVASDQMLHARAAYDLGYRSGLLDADSTGAILAQPSQNRVSARPKHDLRIFEGTAEIQQLVISRAISGMQIR